MSDDLRFRGVLFRIAAVETVPSPNEVRTPTPRLSDLSSHKHDMTTPTPFQIHVPDSLLEQTKRKLSSARLPDQLEGVNWEGPFPSIPPVPPVR